MHQLTCFLGPLLSLYVSPSGLLFSSALPQKMKGHQDSVKGTREACVIFRSHGLSHFPSVNPDRRDRLQREKRTLFDSYFEGSTPRGCLESAQEMHLDPVEQPFETHSQCWYAIGPPLSGLDRSGILAHTPTVCVLGAKGNFNPINSPATCAQALPHSHESRKLFHWITNSKRGRDEITVIRLFVLLTLICAGFYPLNPVTWRKK